MIRKLFLFLVMGGMLIGCGSAGISYKWTSQIVIEDMPDCDIQDVYDALSPANGDLLLYPDTVDPTIWYVNRTILVDRSNFTLSPDRGVSEIRIDNQLGGKQAYTIHGTPGAANGIIMDGITYTGWDMLNNTPRDTLKRTLELSKGHINNTRFINTSEVKLYNLYGGEFSNISLINCSEELILVNSNNVSAHNLYISCSVGSFSLSNTTHSNFSDIYIEHIDKYGIMLLASSNYNSFNNVTINNVANYLEYQTGYYAFGSEECNYTTVKNLNANGTGWSTLAPGGSYGYYENLTLKNSGHNTIDLHSVRHATFKNVSLYAPAASEFTLPFHKMVNNILFTAGLQTSPYTVNITMTDVYMYNAGISMINGVNNISITNLTSEGEGNGVSLSVDDCILRNMTLKTRTGHEQESKLQIITYSEALETAKNITIIDSSFHWLSAIMGTRTRLVNTRYSMLTYKNHTNYYYGDVAVKTGTGTPLSGTVTFTNENTTNSKFSSTDGLAENKQIFNVTTGRTILPDSDRFDSAAIADTWNDPNGTVINFEQTASVDTPQGSVTLTDINPDSRWYRTNPQQSKYTITALINDSENLHFIGYAPTPEYNIFNSGESVKFQIWTNEPLTSVIWKKDGQTLQTGGMTYEATISDAPVTVDILGESASGTISKTWVVDPEQVIDPTPDPGVLAPVAKFSAGATSGAYPVSISFTDQSENVPTNWYWDFDNNGEYDSTLQNPVYKYKAKGNYTVKLVVSNTNNTDFETKTAYINVTGTALTKRITHSIRGYFYNIFYQIFGLGTWLA